MKTIITIALTISLMLNIFLGWFVMSVMNGEMEIYCVAEQSSIVERNI